MISAHEKRAVPPEADAPQRAVWAASTRPVDVEYVGKMEAVVFRSGDGRIFGVPLRDFDGIDGTPVTRVSIVDDGDTVLIEQFSGNRLEVPWDVVLSACARGPRWVS